MIGRPPVRSFALATALIGALAVGASPTLAEGRVSSLAASPAASSPVPAHDALLAGWLLMERFGQAPDGSMTQLDFDRRQRWLVRPDGSGLHELAPGSPTSGKVSPGVSPDGSRIAFSSWQPLEQVYETDVKGTAPTLLSGDCSGSETECQGDRRDAEQTGALTSAMQETVGALLARNIESASVASWAASVEMLMAARGLLTPRATQPSVVAFVDFSGFPRLTEELGDDGAPTSRRGLVEEAEKVTAVGTGARIVKLLGDGVMLHGVEASAALDAALTLVEPLPHAGLPGAHAGVHAGPVIERDGDLFGRTVNLAARITGAAREGEVLVSSDVVAVIERGFTRSECCGSRASHDRSRLGGRPERETRSEESHGERLTHALLRSRPPSPTSRDSWT
jgi:class 3 adenylate cyclase